MAFLSLEEKVAFIIEKTGISRKELQNLIESKKREMGGLISDEGALHLVARDLGVNLSEIEEYKPIKIYVKDLRPEMRSVTLVGRVNRIYPVREFDRRGVQGKVASAILSDLTGNIRVVLWGDHAKLVESGNLKEGMIVRIVKGYVKESLKGDLEVHVGQGGRVEIEPEGVDENEYPVTERRMFKIDELMPEMRDIDLEAVVQRVYPTTMFSRETGEGKRKSLIITDETGSIRAVFWDENAELIESVKEGDVLLIEGGYTKLGLQGDVELHVGKLARITIKPSKIAEKITKLSDLEPGMPMVNIEGKVVVSHGVREFTRNDGTIGVMASLTIMDGTGSVRVVAWGDQAENVADAEVGDILKVRGGYTRIGMNGEVEVHMGRFSKAIVIPMEEQLEPLQKGVPTRKFLFQLKDGDFADVRGTLRRLLRKKAILELCPICRKLITNGNHCPKCEKVEAKPALFVSALIDDGTAVVKAVFIGKEAEKLLGINVREAYEIVKREDDESAPLKLKAYNLEGKELSITGKITLNPVTGKLTLMVYSFKEANPKDEAEKLISQIESLK